MNQVKVKSETMIQRQQNITDLSSLLSKAGQYDFLLSSKYLLCYFFLK